MKFLRILYAGLLLVFIGVSFSCAPEQVTLQQITTAYPDPARFEKDIQAFETEDKTSPPPPGAIVCTGSSSMRMWRSIHEDLAPLTIIHRGFGGRDVIIL